MVSVRFLLALTLAAALAAGEDDAELARAVEELVEALGSTSTEARMLARQRLAAYGDRIRPLLERVDSPDPEVRRSIRMLVRTAGKIEIELLPRADEALPIGAPLVLDVRVLNNTDQTLLLLPDVARQQPVSPFRVRIGKTLVPIGFDQVNWGTDGPARILPGSSRRFRVTLAGGSEALRRPALYDVSVVFQGNVGKGHGLAQEDTVETEHHRMETEIRKVHVVGRRPEELERALASDEPRQREDAIAELALRDDEAVVPILRRNAKDGALRLAAVRRLGALGAAEDFDLVYEAARTDESVDVRRAAALGLGNYAGFKARSLLRAMTADDRVQSEAIRALAKHKHHATIECFMDLLRPGKCARENVILIRSTLREWTGQSVDQRPSELAAFRAWWERNRQQWAKENGLSDK